MEQGDREDAPCSHWKSVTDPCLVSPQSLSPSSQSPPPYREALGGGLPGKSTVPSLWVLTAHILFSRTGCHHIGVRGPTH